MQMYFNPFRSTFRSTFRLFSVHEPTLGGKKQTTLFICLALKTFTGFNWRAPVTKPAGLRHSRSSQLFPNIAARHRLKTPRGRTGTRIGRLRRAPRLLFHYPPRHTLMTSHHVAAATSFVTQDNIQAKGRCARANYPASYIYTLVSKRATLCVCVCIPYFGRDGQTPVIESMWKSFGCVLEGQGRCRHLHGCTSREC